MPSRYWFCKSDFLVTINWYHCHIWQLDAKYFLRNHYFLVIFFIVYLKYIIKYTYNIYVHFLNPGGSEKYLVQLRYWLILNCLRKTSTFLKHFCGSPQIYHQKPKIWVSMVLFHNLWGIKVKVRWFCRQKLYFINEILLKNLKYSID